MDQFVGIGIIVLVIGGVSYLNIWLDRRHLAKLNAAMSTCGCLFVAKERGTYRFERRGPVGLQVSYNLRDGATAAIAILPRDLPIVFSIGVPVGVGFVCGASTPRNWDDFRKRYDVKTDAPEALRQLCDSPEMLSAMTQLLEYDDATLSIISSGGARLLRNGGIETLPEALVKLTGVAELLAAADSKNHQN